MLGRQGFSWSLIMVGICLGYTDGLAATLKITDASDSVYEATEVFIDYTSRFPAPSLFLFDRPQADLEKEGIRVYLGEAVVTIAWEKIHKVEVRSGPDTELEGTSDRLEAKVILKNRTAQKVFLVLGPNPVLSGETALGKFTLELKKVKDLVVIDPKEQKAGTGP